MIFINPTKFYFYDILANFRRSNANGILIDNLSGEVATCANNNNNNNNNSLFHLKHNFIFPNIEN